MPCDPFTMLPNDMTKKFLLLIVLASCFIVVNAQQNKRADTLKIDGLLNLSFEELMNVTVITPTLNLQKSNQVPATVRVITMEQIKLRGYRNLAEILNDLPDFTVTDKSDPQFYNRISSRGVSRQDYFIVLLNGVKISSPTNEPLPFLENFPIYLAKQIEVVYGPGSALYGADAMAGVINIITQEVNADKTATVTAMGGTHGYSNTSAIISRRFENDVKFSLAGLYSYDAQPDFSKIYKDQYDMTSHKTGVFNSSFGSLTPQRPVEATFESPVRAYNIYSSINKGGFSMNILHHYVAVPTSTTFKPDNGVYNKDVFYGQGVTSASASYSVSSGKFKSISTLVASYYSVDPKSNFRNIYSGMEAGYKYSTGSMSKAEQQVNFSYSKKLNFIGGLTYELFQAVPKTPELQYPVSRKGAASGILLNSISENNPAGIEAKFFPLVYRNIGSYFQTQYAPWTKLSFTAGIRYDHNSRFGATINPRIGAVFQPFRETTLKALFGTAYWAPSPLVSFESYGSFYTTDSGNTYRSAYWHLPNPGLKPVTSETIEVSINQKIGKQFSITLTAYSSHIRNLIKDVPDNGHTDMYHNKFLGWDVDYIDITFNQGTQQNLGGNLSVNSTFEIGKLECNAYASLSYLDGKISEDESDDKFIEQGAITPWQFRAGLDAKLGSFYFSTRLLQSGKQRMTTMDESNSTKRQLLEGYSLVNVSAGYTIKDRATLFVNVQNALNERYFNSLEWDSEDSDGSFQNPLRAAVGVRVGF